MFYIKYLLTFALYIAAAIFFPPSIRGMQQIAGIVVDTAEKQLSIAPDYMVLAQMADAEGKLAFLLFAAVVLNAFRVFDMIRSLIGKMRTSKAKSA